MNEAGPQQTIENQDFSESRPFEGELQGYLFRSCNFMEADLSELTFIDCAFDGCNLSMVEFGGAKLQNVIFRNSKLMGVDFADTSDFGLSLSFEECNLNYSSFVQKSMKNAQFTDCTLQEANFTETDLKGAAFSHCNLGGAVFFNTNLTSSDLRTASHFSIDPASNRIRKARFSRSGLAGLLEKYELILD